MVHVQAAHMINIYELGHDATNNNHLNSNNNIISDTSNNNNIAKNDNASLDDATSNKINGDAIDKLDTINMAECIDENRMLIMSANNVSTFSSLFSPFLSLFCALFLPILPITTIYL